MTAMLADAVTSFRKAKTQLATNFRRSDAVPGTSCYTNTDYSARLALSIAAAAIAGVANALQSPSCWVIYPRLQTRQ